MDIIFTNSRNLRSAIIFYEEGHFEIALILKTAPFFTRKRIPTIFINLKIKTLSKVWF